MIDFLDTSMLERLMHNPLYQRNPATKKFNEMFVTQLVKNYRSHECILKLSNEMFYENTLEVCASKGKVALTPLNIHFLIPLFYFQRTQTIFSTHRSSCRRNFRSSSTRSMVIQLQRTQEQGNSLPPTNVNRLLFIPFIP